MYMCVSGDKWFSRGVASLLEGLSQGVHMIAHLPSEVECLTDICKPEMYVRRKVCCPELETKVHTHRTGCCVSFETVVQ